MVSNQSTSPAAYPIKWMICKSEVDEAHYMRVWSEYVYTLNGAYEMNP